MASTKFPEERLTLETVLGNKNFELIPRHKKECLPNYVKRKRNSYLVCASVSWMTLTPLSGDLLLSKTLLVARRGKLRLETRFGSQP